MSAAVPKMLFRPITTESDHLLLRTMLPEDVTETYVSWMNDPSVTQFLESRFEKHTLENLREYVGRMLGSPNTVLLAILEKPGLRHIGNLKLGPIESVHERSEIGILIGEKDAWGHGYATEAIKTISRFAFQELGLRKLTAGCYATNVGSRRAFEKAGFTCEAVRPRHYRSGEQIVDAVLLGRFRHDD